MRGSRHTREAEDNTQQEWNEQLGRPYTNVYLICLPLTPSFLSPRTVSSAGVLGAHLLCSRVPGLTARQSRICTRAPDAMVAISEGARAGLRECQRQFQHHRWNCSLASTSSSAFGHIVLVGSREAAYTYAVTSSGVTHSVTTACSRGNITFGCDDRRRGRYSSSGWKWGGCSADIRFGVRFAKKFLDAREVEGDGRALMNLHNNRAGGRAVRSGIRTECKCHGVPGSCTVKTCWKTLPPFTFIGKHLFHKYRKAKSVSVHKGRRRSTPHLRLERVRRRARRPRKFHLVYLERSPNYCQMNPAVGSLGTMGRKCNRTSSGPGGCDLLCCAGGYNTHQYTRTWHCNCKFHWCCYVQCHTCMEDTEENNCK
ncbi:protein Wnt-7b-like [Eriocheir sinensis]|uniref:protein Wnt-7b-like n=1 Tax=Eriocheir sinensis TaxID=95602 RepID=UPI0021C7F9AC|nr:protein Wnt-7b-like [Eriocheir sinensis]